MRLTGLKKIRKSSGKTQEEVARELDIPLSSYQGWEQLKNNPELPRVNILADYFRCSVDELMGRTDYAVVSLDTEEDPSYIDVPLYGKIAAGSPIEKQQIDDHFPIPMPMFERYPNCFLLEVDGESMNKKLPNGAYALVDPDQLSPIDYKPYALCVNGFDATIKRVHKLNNGYELLPDSSDPTYEPKTYNYNEPDTEEITVIGRVVWFTMPFDWEV